LGLRARWSRPLSRAVFRGLDFGKAIVSAVLLIILADNYNLKTNDQTTESQSAQRLFGKSSDFRAVSGW
jgi:hypothetical protein